MLGAVFVEDGIGVVDVDKDATALGRVGELIEQAAWAGERQVAHIAGGFFASAGADEFVVAPEGAVDQGEVTGGGEFCPFRIAAG